MLRTPGTRASPCGQMLRLGPWRARNPANSAHRPRLKVREKRRRRRRGATAVDLALVAGAAVDGAVLTGWLPRKAGWQSDDDEHRALAAVTRRRPARDRAPQAPRRRAGGR